MMRVIWGFIYMSKFIIHESKNLHGEIAVMGAKNAAMKMIAACILIPGKVVLENVPDISDVDKLVEILKEDGAQIERLSHTLTLDTTNMRGNDPNPLLVKKFRGSIVLIGPYLARFGKISLPQPGGCNLGTRSIDTHLRAFENIGTKTTCDDKMNHLKLDNNLGGEITLEEASVTGTENIIMSQVLGKQETIIRNTATEPQITDLINFLNNAGAKITGAGTRTLTIKGVEKLHETTYRVMPDPFETATFICLAIVTQSELKIINCNPIDMYPFLDKIKEIGVDLELGDDYILVKKSDSLKPTDIVADIHPGFSTDMLSPMGLVLTKATGISHINEKLFENRLGYLKELQKMGANVKILNEHEAEITGPTPLEGAQIESLDLRAGATVILAGLAASGTTEILNAEIVYRGYENIDERLRQLGADIERVEK